MESFSNIVKRKRRKTRKCLDEIRKRSRRTNQNIASENYKTNITRQNVQSNLLTSNRITLCMFPKAIRSETVTRPTLENFKEMSTHAMDDVIKRAKLNMDRVHIKEYNKNEIEHFGDINNCNSRYVRNNDFQHNHINTSYRKDNSSEIFLLNPMNCADKTKKPLVDVSSSIPLSPQNLTKNNSYSLYKEFMSEIPEYIKENKSPCSDEDVLKKTKICLQNLFLESRNQEYQNFLKCSQINMTKIFNSNENKIVHNPRDYIQLGCVQHRSINMNSPLSEHVHTPHSSVGSPLGPTIVAETTSSFGTINTPEYTFYPHPLN